MLAGERMRVTICGNVLDPRAGLKGDHCIEIQDGVVSSIRDEPQPGPVVDVRGEPGVYVLPGLVDMHVHLRGLGLSYKEDEYTGSMAAARGGITLVADMPNTVPRIDTPSALAAKLNALREKSVVEYRVYAAIPGTRELVNKLAQHPEVAGFKVYPHDLARRHDIVDYIAGRKETLLVLHPELPEAEKAEHENLTTRSYSRGCHWETAAVHILAPAKARLHITHASCSSTVRAAKELGATVDVTPHHLFLETPGRGCLWKVNPPLRERTERLLLLRYLLEGLVDAIASDHAPHSVEEKNAPPLTCPPGIAWLEAWPHMLSCLVSSRALSMEEYVELASVKPASIIGARRCLEPGCPGSITIIKIAERRFEGNVFSKAKRTPYFMERLCSDTVATLVRGRLVYLEPGRRLDDMM